jgi:hypothetical protein
MKADHLIELLEERPFVPLRLHMSDGRKHDIRHPEMAIVSDEIIAVGLYNDDNSLAADRITNCSAAHVVEVEPLQSPQV